MMKETKMKRVPKLRFPEFTDDWEQRKVGKLVEDGIIDAPLDGNHGEKHPTADEYVDDGIPFLMASDIHNGIVDIVLCKYITPERAERLDKGFARNGDVLITHKATIGETAILQDLKTPYAVLTPQVTYYRIQNEEKLNRKYLYAYFNSREFQNDLKAKAAQSTRPYIGISAQQNLLVYLPSKLKEQEKIGEYFCNLDHLITLHQRKLKNLNVLKKCVMQKLFSQKVRFKADDGSEFPKWKEKRLGDVFTERTERSKGGETLLSVTIAQGIVRQSETDKRNTASENKSNYKIVKRNDLAYNTMRMWQGAEGVSEYDGIVSPAYTVITALDGNNSYFFEILFKQTFMLQIFQRYSQGLTSDTWNLKFPAFSEIKCLVPCEDEQNKIVECVKVLDSVIEKQKATLAAWEELKKGLLQQMFV